MGTPRRTLLASAVALPLALAACSSSTSTTPSGSAGSPTPSFSFSPEPIPTGTHTAGSPVPLPVTLTKGSAAVKVTGAVKEHISLHLGANRAYARAPGHFSLSYVDKRGDALIVGGTTPKGTAKTSSALILSLVVQAKHPLAFPSATGQCSVTVTKATASSFSATFTCRKLSRAGKTIHATGTFVASK